MAADLRKDEKEEDGSSFPVAATFSDGSSGAVAGPPDFMLPKKLMYFLKLKDSFEKFENLPRTVLMYKHILLWFRYFCKLGLVQTI